MNNYNKDLIFYRVDTSKLDKNAETEFVISDLKIRYRVGKDIVTAGLSFFVDPQNKCVNTFITSNQKARQATLCFIWFILAQGILPREIIYKIAREIWDSRISPHLWGVFI